MGCRLPKLRKAEEKRSPGNIYSTLRRPQVETKVGVAYTYHFLDFLLGKEEVPVSSVLCLSSVRELPVQVRDLYAQGFVLVAVHPFVHPCGPRHAHIQRQLHRAVLVRETHSLEKSNLRWARHRLETDVCVASQQAADPEVIQNYVKKIQDVAEQGVMFVGFLQQPGSGPYFLGHWDPEELSSLHSSPSPIHRHPFSSNTSPTDPTEPNSNNAEADFCCCESQDVDRGDVDYNASVSGDLKRAQSLALNPEEDHIETSQKDLRTSTNGLQNHIKPDADKVKNITDARGNQFNVKPPGTAGTLCKLAEDKHFTGSAEKHSNFSHQREKRGSSSDSWLSSPELGDKKLDSNRVTTHNNNHIRLKKSENKGATSPPAQARTQLFALYNHTGELNTSLRFYSLRVPLQVQKEAGLITDLDANWLDHMTQHFIYGAHLVDGFFHLPNDNDDGVSSVDSVFIFQSSAEEPANASYDAIVVEQWTVVDLEDKRRSVHLDSKVLTLHEAAAARGALWVWQRAEIMTSCRRELLPAPVGCTQGVVVKTDYIPLLQSLAPYGWRLMCVIPTPIVKTNSDGSLSTKQILFLQRPVLQRKRKDFKMLSLRGRSKPKKHFAGEALDEQESKSLVIETEMDRLRVKEEEEEEGRSRRASLQSGEDASHQKSFSLLLERRSSAEEETNVDEVPQEKSRWTGFCQSDAGALKEVRVEERIKHQLFSGVC